MHTNGDPKLRYAAQVLTDFGRRCRASGVVMPVELEALAALLANGRHSTPFLGDPDGGRLLLTYAQAAEALAVSGRTFTRLVGSGAVPTVTVAGSPRVAVGDLKAYVDGLARRKGANGGAAGETQEQGR